MSTKTKVGSSGPFGVINCVAWFIAGASLLMLIFQPPTPPPPPNGEACSLVKMVTVGRVYEVVMVKDSLAVVRDQGTKKIVLTQSMSHEVDIDNARLEAGKRYNCISVNLGYGDKVKLVISKDTIKTTK
jgi:hypothetical protein